MRDGEDIRGVARNTRVVCGLFVLLLCAAVFSWGLHSKLSLYNVPLPSQSSLPIAKLLSEQERPSVLRTDRQLRSEPPQRIVLAFLLTALPALFTNIAGPERRDETVATPIGFRFSGPSQLRPPPVQAA